MVYKEQLVVALVLKGLGIALPNKELAERVVAAQVVVEALTNGRIDTNTADKLASDLAHAQRAS
jgi:hypothetical protein